MKPERNPAHLRFVRALPCCICGQTWHIEAAHVGPHGLSQKAPDTETLPLCHRDHRDPEVGLDRLAARASYNRKGEVATALDDALPALVIAVEDLQQAARAKRRLKDLPR